MPSDDEPPKRYALRLGNRVEQEIAEATARFVELTDEATAQQWQQGLFRLIATLATHPQRYPVVSPNGDIPLPINHTERRKMPYAHCSLICLLIANSDTL